MTVYLLVIYYCVLGIAFGIVVAGGLFAFITTVGALTRLAAGTKTAKYVMPYETMVILGVTFFNVVDLFSISIPTGFLLKAAYGLFSGVFVGCLAAALAEVVQVFPVFFSRIQLRVGVPVVVFSFALGKGIGAWYQLIFSTFR